jgi:predicted MFS family arabinose efflux permease
MLMGCLIMTTFILVPYMPSYLVANVGMHEDDVKYIYLFGGIGTLVTMTPIGRLADRFGKLRVFQVLAFLALFPILAVTHLPPVPLYLVLIVTTCMMIFTAGRGVPAMAMVTACTTSDRRGGFMSVLGAVQQLAMGIATTVGGLILGVQAHADQTGVVKDDLEPITGFPIVGWIAAVICLISVYLGSRLRSVETNTVPKQDIAPDEAMLAVEMEMT